MAAKKRADGNLDRRSARLTREQREDRNAQILHWFLMGHSERYIANHPKVRLTAAGVHNIIAAELQKAAKRQGSLGDMALIVYKERLEFLFGRAMPKAAEGDLKAIEVGRRLLESYARLYDWADERGGPAFITPPMSDEELSLLDEDNPAYDALDDLTKYRLRQRREQQSM